MYLDATWRVQCEFTFKSKLATNRKIGKKKSYESLMTPFLAVYEFYHIYWNIGLFYKR